MSSASDQASSSSVRPPRRATGERRTANSSGKSLGGAAMVAAMAPYMPWLRPADALMAFAGTKKEKATDIAATLVAWPLEYMLNIAYMNWATMNDLYNEAYQLVYQAESKSSEVQYKMYNMVEKFSQTFNSSMMSGADLIKEIPFINPTTSTKQNSEW